MILFFARLLALLALACEPSRLDYALDYADRLTALATVLVGLHRQEEPARRPALKPRSPAREDPSTRSSPTAESPRRSGRPATTRARSTDHLRAAADPARILFGTYWPARPARKVAAVTNALDVDPSVDRDIAMRQPEKALRLFPRLSARPDVG